MEIKHISKDQLAAQQVFAQEDRVLLRERFGRTPRALVKSFGCAQNVNDGEKLMGMLKEMGCTFTDSVEEADIALYNTCAIRENAEQKVFGIIGQATHQKAGRKEMLIGLCGCMAQQEHIAEKIKKSFPGVDMVFGTHVVHTLPEIIHEVLMPEGKKRRRVFDIPECDGVIAEGLPTVREDSVRAGLPIMYGCNNFCTYCVVPLVRGRERSRRSADILAEAKDLIAKGYKEITLLGTNVNSYGKDLEDDLSFPQLLEAVGNLPGDFWVRFMTSHPRDCTKELIDVIARTPKVCNHIHLPVQSGSDRILKEMNRHYTREQYLSIIDYAKKTIPDVTFTSDIIVGFPGETYEEFGETLSLIQEVGYSSLFTFIFSPRVGTRAAEMDDPVPAAEKSRWFNELLETQKACGMTFYEREEGKTLKVLCEGYGKTKNGILSEDQASEGKSVLMGRTERGMVVDFAGDPSLIGQFVDVTITRADNWALAGELAKPSAE